jgi:hypothetical protein
MLHTLSATQLHTQQSFLVIPMRRFSFEELHRLIDTARRVMINKHVYMVGLHAKGKNAQPYFSGAVGEMFREPGTHTLSNALVMVFRTPNEMKQNPGVRMGQISISLSSK